MRREARGESEREASERRARRARGESGAAAQRRSGAAAQRRSGQWWSISRYIVHLVTYRMYITRNENSAWIMHQKC